MFINFDKCMNIFTEKILKKYNDCKYNKLWRKQLL